MTPELGTEQAAVFRLLNETPHNYFITGKAGTGKSVLLQYFVSHTLKNTAVIAPTGVAAINVGGQTIHSFFGLDLDIQDVRDTETVAKISKRRRKIYENLDTIVIDEISMVSADVMDMIDHKLRIARGKDTPFGGCQMVVFGDLYQLPPVIVGDTAKQFMRDHYGTTFFFGAPGVKEGNFQTIELSHIYRQKDEHFIELLNSIRLGKRTDDILSDINMSCVEEPCEDDTFITLAATNAVADNINRKRLAEIPEPEYSFDGTITGDLSSSALPTEANLKLKVGALVMMTKNDTNIDSGKKPRWANGTLAVISGLTPDSIKVRIDNSEYKIDKTTWEKCQYDYDEKTKTISKDVVGTFTQFPVKLAYAITIHKSQGQTYSAVKIDLARGAFAPGQVYVALSRCQNLNNLYLTRPLSARDIIVSPTVVDYMDRTAKIVDPDSL